MRRMLNFMLTSAVKDDETDGKRKHENKMYALIKCIQIPLECSHSAATPSPITWILSWTRGVENIIFLKRTSFWIVTPCSFERVQSFGKTYRHIFLATLAWLFAWFYLLPSRRKRYISLKSRAFSELHGVTTQETVLFKITAVINSGPTAQFMVSNHPSWIMDTFCRSL
jgi:hypothetical protein